MYVLGNETAIAAAISDQLASVGYHIVRLGGATRFETATAVAHDGLGDPATVLLADGTDFPDAVSAGNGAAAAKGAILLTNGATMDPTTAAYLAAHPSDTVFAVGGPAAQADPTATPLVGSDRYETSSIVAAHFYAAPTAAGIATGLAFPDALDGGADIAGSAGPMLLVRPHDLPATIQSYLHTHRVLCASCECTAASTPSTGPSHLTP